MRRSSLLWVILLLLLVWWILADPRPGAWMVGFVAALLGAGLHAALGGGRRSGLQGRALLAFLPYFAWQSLKGGWDVSRRALSPSLPLDPDLLTLPLELPPGLPRVFLTNTLSLLPGTFGAELRGDELIVHLLVAGPEAEARIRELEGRIARVFGVSAS
jgi:multicomponent Na+:H+ antiporter subunit E